MINKQLKSIYSVFTCLLFLFYISCKEKETKTKIKGKHYTSYSDNKVAYDLHFPDTVHINQKYNGKIVYKGILDSITTTFGDKKKDRYILYMMTTTDRVDYDFKHLKKIAKDTFGATNYRTIPFYDVKFNKLGVHYIDGYINDNVLLDILTKDNISTDKVRYIENEVRATHKVVVIE
ncbi:hypothetical protein [Flavobacterium sp.]|uniref:hypothetical protein n=1 Tax=Flavobacterium sp. TaxID=239 RepID=UPI00286B4A12|nr:hypothetical protein [Flavobacterium sp.]